MEKFSSVNRAKITKLSRKMVYDFFDFVISLGVIDRKRMAKRDKWLQYRRRGQ